MSNRRLLLMAPQRDDLMSIGRALRDAGYLVFPARFHEFGHDAVVRVRPDLILIDSEAYKGIASETCREAVRTVGSRVVLFQRVAGSGDGASLHALPGTPYPVVDYTGDARALATLLEAPGELLSA